VSTVDPFNEILYFIYYPEPSVNLIPNLAGFYINNSTVASFGQLASDIICLEFDSQRNVLFGLTADGDIVSIDTITASLTPITNIQNPIGICAYDVDDHIFYSISLQTAEEDFRIIGVNTNTALTVTDVTTTFSFTSLEIDAVTGVLYGTVLNNPHFSLVSIDTTGSISILHNFTEQQIQFANAAIEHQSRSNSYYIATFIDQTSQQTILVRVDLQSFESTSTPLVNTIITIDYMPPIGCDGIPCKFTHYFVLTRVTHVTRVNHKSGFMWTVWRNTSSV
jgi:hypothetical protein